MADALAHLVTPTLTVEAPLALPGDDAQPVGSLVAFAAGEDGLDPRAARALSVLEQIAWVFVLGLLRRWHAWRTPGVWPGLDPGEQSLCRVALERVRRAASARPPGASDAGVLHRLRVDRRWDPTAWPTAPDSGSHPRAVDENVQFTVYRPRRIPVDTWCTVLAFAHLAERRPDAPANAPDPADEVRRQAAQVLGDLASTYADTTQDSAEAIPARG